MNKKLVWYGGTKTQKHKIEKGLDFEKLKNHGIDVLAIDGIATLENTLSEKFLSEKKTSKKRSNTLKNIIDEMKGYNEQTHLVQLNKVFDTFNNLTQPTELIMGGHSRGAAAGLTGFITELYALALISKPKTSDFAKSLENVQQINLIVVDPVQGPLQGNLLGLQKNLKHENPIKEMLDTISAVANKPNLFNVSIFFPKFADKKIFKLDKNWEHYIKKSKGEYKEYNSGFYHSHMVNPEDKTKLFPLDKNNISPNGLLKQVIKERFGLITPEELNKTVIDLHKTEVDLMQILKKENTNRTQTEKAKVDEFETLVSNNKKGALNKIESALRNNSNDTAIKINGRTLNPKLLDTKKNNLSPATTTLRSQSSIPPTITLSLKKRSPLIPTKLKLQK